MTSPAEPLLRDAIADALSLERDPRERVNLGKRLLRQVRDRAEQGLGVDPADLHVIEAALEVL